MSYPVMLLPVGSCVGLTSVTLGVVRAMEYKSIYFKIFNPIIQNNPKDGKFNQNFTSPSKDLDLLVTHSFEMNHIQSLIFNNQKNVLMEEIASNFYKSTKGAKAVLIKGIISIYNNQFIQTLNYDIAKMLNAKVIFVISHDADTQEQIKERIKIIHNSCRKMKSIDVIGVIINKINAPIKRKNYTCLNLHDLFNNFSKMEIRKTDLVNLPKNSPLPILGMIPWNSNLASIRATDIACHLNASIINEGDKSSRRVKSVSFFARYFPEALGQFCAESLLIVPIDRYDVLSTAYLMEMNNVKLSAILLTDGCKANDDVIKLYKPIFSTGLPIYMVKTNIWQTCKNLQDLNLRLLPDDFEHIEKVQKYVANYINTDLIKSLISISERKPLLSPVKFRYQLFELAQKENKRIILPEGNEPRIIKAATICAKYDIATCVLLGNPAEVNRVAMSQGIELEKNIEIIDPSETFRKKYLHRLIELRKNKGITETIALEQLKDNVVLGTLMLEKNEVDGLLSGAIHTTANTIRPPLQLIKVAPGNSIVSSVFFMLLPEQVYVYGDCAINTNPTAEQLAEIAIQSAFSAVTFGIDPYVAMLSYSTDISGSGSDVEKVRKATKIAKERCPNLIIDGPLQYDAAVVADIAKSKAPYSPVAGRATVFIFPDLNSGNITYKAVQRSSNTISIGPILQGMRKPVNDLSRGALVDDIVYTIAITAIQAANNSIF